MLRVTAIFELFPLGLLSAEGVMVASSSLRLEHPGDHTLV